MINVRSLKLAVGITADNRIVIGKTVHFDDGTWQWEDVCKEDRLSMSISQACDFALSILSHAKSATRYERKSITSKSKKIKEALDALEREAP